MPHSRRIEAAARMHPQESGEILSRSIRGAYRDQLKAIAPFRHIHRDDLTDAINHDFTVALARLKDNGRIGVDARCYLLAPIDHSYKQLFRDTGRGHTAAGEFKRLPPATRAAKQIYARGKDVHRPC